MAKRKGPSTSGPRTRSRVAKERQVEDTRRLDKLPPEVWEKVFDNLDEDDLFPLALSCRYFRQKQKELVAQARQNGPGSRKPRLTLKTALKRKVRERQPASAEYLRFCSKERVSSLRGRNARDKDIRCLAAFHGHLPLLQELLAGFDWIGSDTKNAAAEGGHLETLKWLKTRKEFKMDRELFKSACKGGNLAMLKLLRSEGCPTNWQACIGAAQGGHVEVLKWLRSEDCPWSEYTWQAAARHGHLEVLKWLRSEGFSWGIACSSAAKGGHLEVLKWLRSDGCPWSEQSCAGAAEGGHLEILKWLRSEGCPWNERTCELADGGGHLDALKYAHENGCPWDELTCKLAAYEGHLDVLKFAHENGCPWDRKTCEMAACRGHLDVLKYAHENGCPWDVWTLEHAVRHGHLDVLKYLRENGCPWNDRSWYCATKSARKWLKENGYLQTLIDEYNEWREWQRNRRYSDDSDVFSSDYISSSDEYSSDELDD